MELRFAERARATKDLTGMEGPARTGSKPYRRSGPRLRSFTFRVKAQTRDMEEADTIRVSVAIQYRTRSWQTIEVDLGPANVGHVDQIEPRVRGLVELGIPVITSVRCLGLPEQVAQKLHACTGPAAADAPGRIGYSADRHAWELTTLLPLCGASRFEERATHAFPPTFVMPPEWRPELET